VNDINPEDSFVAISILWQNLPVQNAVELQNLIPPELLR